eukprot:TRINITY_DN6329_c0_g1_i1.p1 TRINITY_DN6329_c0_g1~~TRINITY_DN6329_c0_g1_i1.p1  ORF type:complete len:279 (-),score=57.81 TRINITY_DN6329_c0_g1_i1:45-881(-)
MTWTSLLVLGVILLGMATADTSVRAYDSCGSGMKIALTFDDGPAVGDGQTERILDILKDLGIKATFFVTPYMYDVEKLSEKCSLVSRMIGDGHYVGCHSWNHSDVSNWSNEDIKMYAVDPCVSWVRDCSGCDFNPTHFRAPYGNLKYDQAKYLCQDLGLTIGFWSMDVFDYSCPGDFNGIWETVSGNMSSLYGSYGCYQSQVIDMHDVNEYNACDSSGKTVIERIYETYGPSGVGYEFVRADECYENCDNMVDGVCKNQQGTHYNICSWPQSSGYPGC